MKKSNEPKKESLNENEEISFKDKNLFSITPAIQLITSNNDDVFEKDVVNDNNLTTPLKIVITDPRSIPCTLTNYGYAELECKCNEDGNKYYSSVIGAISDDELGYNRFLKDAFKYSLRRILYVIQEKGDIPSIIYVKTDKYMNKNDFIEVGFSVFDVLSTYNLEDVVTIFQEQQNKKSIMDTMCFDVYNKKKKTKKKNKKK